MNEVQKEGTEKRRTNPFSTKDDECAALSRNIM